MKNWLRKNIKTTKTFGIITVAILLFIGVLFFVLINNKKESTLLGSGIKEIEIKNTPFEMPALAMPTFPDNFCNIKNYGAIGNGKFINTQAIKNAIEDCYKKGGGHVVFPKGKWLTGPIHFENNIHIEIEKGAEIVFTTNLDDYLPVVFSKFQTMEYYNFSPPIYANNCENIALSGKGKITGNGEFWAKWARTPNSEIERDNLFRMSQKEIPTSERIFGQKDSGLRPSFIQFVNCKNILIEGIHIGDGPMWTIHPIYSENIIISDINIETHSMNTDGIAIDSSKNILIENSNFSTGDDSIAIKSGLEDEGIKTNRPSENIAIRNCNFIEGHGAISIGSEMSGGIRNVLAENLFFSNSSSGFRIKSTRSRGGIIENIWLKNIKMKDIEETLVVFNLGYQSALKTKNTDTTRRPILRNIHLENMKGNSMDEAISVSGLKDGIMENIALENINFQSKNGSELKYAENINFKNIFLKIENDEKPAVLVDNSSNIKFDNMSCDNQKGFCIVLKGERISNIDLTNSNIGQEKISIEQDKKTEDRN